MKEDALFCIDMSRLPSKLHYLNLKLEFIHRLEYALPESPNLREVAILVVSVQYLTSLKATSLLRLVNRASRWEWKQLKKQARKHEATV